MSPKSCNFADADNLVVISFLRALRHAQRRLTLIKKRRPPYTIHKTMKRLTMTMLAALFAMLASAQVADAWRLVWSDEFNGDGPYDAATWESERGFVRNHEDQWYQGENAFRKDGCLVIECRKTDLPNPMFRPQDGQPTAQEDNARRRPRNDWRTQRERIGYTSASLTTRRSFNFLYGRLEVRARIPVAGGSWPAI